MPRKKSIVHREDKITSSSSSNDADDHNSVGADHECHMRHVHRHMMWGH